MSTVLSCKLERNPIRGMFKRNYASESVVETYRIQVDAFGRDLTNILSQAILITPVDNDPLPARGSAWAPDPFYGLYTDEYNITSWNEQQKYYAVEVSYTPIQPNESNTGEEPGSNDNPLLWPTVYDVQFIEEEYVVEVAKNVQAFTGTNFTRAALTEGPVTNSAGDESEDPLVDVDRIAVIKATKNVASIDDIIGLNADFIRTTNSDTYVGVGPRRLKFLGCESGGRNVANGYVYYPRTVSVGIYKTTDRDLNNVGFNYIKDGEKVRRLVKDPETDEMVPTTTPLFLTNAGGQSDDATKVSYRYLEEVAYTGLLS